MRARFAVAIAFLGLIASRPALAQTAAPAATPPAPPPVHKADALFNAGRNLLEAGEYAEACPKFLEANNIAPGLGVTLYLADCYERLGKTASALQVFRQAAALARARADKRESIAAGRADALQARVPKLVVNVSPEAQAQHVDVTQDGVRLPSSAWGVSAAIDPGDHVVDVTADGKAARHIKFHLAATADTHTETIGALDDPPVTPAVEAVVVPPPAAPPAPPPRSNRTYIVVAVAAAGVGVVGIGVGTGLGLVASSKFSDSNNGPCNASNHCSPAGLSLRSDAEQAGTISTIAFAVGGAAIAAGAVVFLVRPKTTSSAASLAVSPSIAQGGGGFNLSGAF